VHWRPDQPPPQTPLLFGRRASDWIGKGIQIEDQIRMKDSTFGDAQTSIKIASKNVIILFDLDLWKHLIVFRTFYKIHFPRVPVLSRGHSPPSPPYACA
jgi:hypothetical protein